MRILLGHLEQRLGDGERGAQFMRGIRRESLLFSDMRFELGQHRVEGVGEFAKLIFTPRQADSMRERSCRGKACRFSDSSQWSEHSAGEKPASQQTEYHQAPTQDGRGWRKITEEIATTRRYVDVGAMHEDVFTSWYVSQEECPHGAQQKSSCDDDAGGVAQREFEANAQTRFSIHGFLPRRGRRQSRS